MAKAPLAYLLLSDIVQEELLLKFALPQLERFTSLPIIIGDIGLSNIAKNQLKKYKIIEPDPRDKLQIGGWFYKPMMISKAYFYANKILYLDNDIQIFESFDPLFDLVEDNKILIAKDMYAGGYNSGIVGVSKSELLNKWMEVIPDTETNVYGDQDVLLSIIRRWPKFAEQIKEMPQEWHVQRLALNNFKGIIKGIHWTGQSGKNHIWENLV